jgi:muramoyltetrapeptide carboxypeptidase
MEGPIAAMGEASVTIGVVAPASPITRDLAEGVQRLARRLFPDRPPTIRFHPQCFATDGHFAGDDRLRARALQEMAADPGIDAIWFARGGYGSCRLLDLAVPPIEGRSKLYLGYSDMGSLLAALHGRGATVAHGPMPSDLNRPGGDVAVARALAYLVDRDRATLEPSLADGRPAMAFNLTILSHLIGTPYEPDVSGRVLMLEEVSEYLYRIDRSLFHVTAAPSIRRAAGIRLGRCSDIPANDRDFGQTEEQIVRHWCDRAGIAFLGRADIGHDIDNKVVPFAPVRPSAHREPPS